MTESATGGRTDVGDGGGDVLLGRLDDEERDALVSHWLRVRGIKLMLLGVASNYPAHARVCDGPGMVERLSQAGWRLVSLGFDPQTDRDRALTTAVEEWFRAAGVDAGLLARESLDGSSSAAA